MLLFLLQLMVNVFSISSGKSHLHSSLECAAVQMRILNIHRNKPHTEFILRILYSSALIIVLKYPRKCRTPLAFLMIVISQFCPYSFKIWEQAHIQTATLQSIQYSTCTCTFCAHHHVDLSYCNKLTTIVQSEWFISYIEDAFYDEFKRDKLICAPSLPACLFLTLA